MVAGLLLPISPPPARGAGDLFYRHRLQPQRGISSALLTDENPDYATRWMNISQVFFCAGAILSPLAVMAYLAGGNRFGGLLLFCAGVIALTGLMILLAGGEMGAKKIDRKRLNMFSVLESRTVVLCAFMVFIYLGCESVGLVYLKQLFLLHGEGSELADLSISLFWVAMILFRLLGTRMDGKEMITLRWLTLMLPLGAVVCLLAASPLPRLIGTALYGAGCGAVWPMLFVLASRSLPRRSGAVFAVMMLFTTAGNTLFPLLIGKWVGNPEITVMLCAALGLLLPALSLPLKRSLAVSRA